MRIRLYPELPDLDELPQFPLAISAGNTTVSYYFYQKTVKLTHKHDLFSYGVSLTRGRLSGISLSISRNISQVSAVYRLKTGCSQCAQFCRPPYSRAAGLLEVAKKTGITLYNQLVRAFGDYESSVRFYRSDSKVMLQARAGRLTSQISASRGQIASNLLYSGGLFIHLKAAWPKRVYCDIPGFLSVSAFGLAAAGVQSPSFLGFSCRALLGTFINDQYDLQTPNSTPTGEARASGCMKSIMLCHRAGDTVLGLVKSFGGGQKTAFYIGV